MGTERLGGTGSGGAGGGGGTTYYATASPGDYAAAAAAPLGVVSIPRAGTAGPAPTSPGTVRAGPADQYVLQRILHAQAGGRSSAMLSLHEFTAGSNELGSTSPPSLFYLQ